MKKCIILLILGFIFLNYVAAKKSISYEYRRALELTKEKDFEKAQEYLNQEIKNNPRNPMAWTLQAYIQYQDNEYSNSITSLEKVYKCSRKRKKLLAHNNYAQSECYLNMKDTLTALNHLNIAIKLVSDDSMYISRHGQIMYSYGDYTDAENDFKYLSNIDHSNADALLWLGKTYEKQRRFKECLDILTKYINMTKEPTLGYSFRSICNLHCGNIPQAVDDVIMSIEYDVTNSFSTDTVLKEVNDSAYDLCISRLRKKSMENPSVKYWPILLGDTYYNNDDYQNAAIAYNKARELTDSNYVLYQLASCMYMMGRQKEAMEFCETMEVSEDKNKDYLYLKSKIFYDMGNLDSAKVDIEQYIQYKSDDINAYFWQAYMNMIEGNNDDAIDEMDNAVALEEGSSLCWLQRGVIYDRMGKRELALKDYAMALKLDTVLSRDSQRCYALLRSSRKEDALDWLSMMLKNFPETGMYYDAACIYSIAGDSKAALQYLEKALSGGYNKFYHISRDFDLDNIRTLPEFSNLIKLYSNKNITAGRINKTLTTSIKMTSENGVYKVPCNINGLDVDMIFDTGSSDISLSINQVNYMLKNGYLTNKDIAGSINYITADGYASKALEIVLSNVKIGDVTLSKVRASVVNGQSAPLLLGQSVLSRFGRIEVDNLNRVINITYNSPR